VSISTSFIISILLLISFGNVYTLPKVSHFALIITLSIFIFVSPMGSFLWASFFASIGALLVSYVRPEYFLAYLLSLLLFILAVVLEYRKQKRLHLTGLTMYALISILLLGLLGLPLSGSKSIVAFGQHFSLNWVSWTGSDINPWTNWQKIVSQNFGPADSIWGAFANNPFVFLKHITYNIWGIIRNSSALVIPTIFPKNILFMGIVALSLIGLCLAYIYNIRNNFPIIRKNFIEHRIILVFIGLFLVPGLVSVVVIYPRRHYLLLIGLLTVVSMAIIGKKASEQQAIKILNKFQAKLLLIGALMIALIPYFLGQFNASRPNFHTLRFIQSLRIEEPVNLLEAEGGYHIYLGDNFHRVAEYDKNTDFNRFLQLRNINMIVVSDQLLKDTRFRDDTDWLDFLAAYPTFGYVEMDVPHTDRKLFIRAELLHR
jgi:hypothetical protein